MIHAVPHFDARRRLVPAGQGHGHAVRSFDGRTRREKQELVLRFRNRKPRVIFRTLERIVKPVALRLLMGHRDHRGIGAVREFPKGSRHLAQVAELIAPALQHLLYLFADIFIFGRSALFSAALRVLDGGADLLVGLDRALALIPLDANALFSGCSLPALRKHGAGRKGDHRRTERKTCTGQCCLSGYPHHFFSFLFFFGDMLCDKLIFLHETPSAANCMIA